MHNSKFKYFKVIVFVIIFVIINDTLNFIFVPHDSYARKTMLEMYSQNRNIDVAFAGSSLTVKQINPYIMDKELKCNTFDYGFNSQIYIGTYYSLKELFKYHKPKMIIVTTDSVSYVAKEENVKEYAAISPNMKSFFNRVEYYFGSSENGSYLDRLFLWRGSHLNTINSIYNNVLKQFDNNYKSYPKGQDLENYKPKEEGYIGKGYEYNTKDVLDYDKIGKVLKKDIGINNIRSKNLEYFKKIVDLCKENQSEVIFLQPPIPTYRIFEQKDYFEFDKEIAKLANDLGVEYYNYNLIKPELFKIRNEYFKDYAHLNGEGARVFSESLAKFLKLRDSGENLNKYFYSPEEYYTSIDYVTNTWFTWKKSNDNKITLTANSFHGSKVVPEYQFILTDLETNKDYIIRDYNKDPNFVFDYKAYKKYKIRVNARVVGSNNDKLTRHYEENIVK